MVSTDHPILLSLNGFNLWPRVGLLSTLHQCIVCTCLCFSTGVEFRCLPTCRLMSKPWSMSEKLYPCHSRQNTPYKPLQGMMALKYLQLDLQNMLRAAMICLLIECCGGLLLRSLISHQTMSLNLHVAVETLPNLRSCSCLLASINKGRKQAMIL